MKRTPLRKISKKQAKRNREFNKKIPPAYKIGLEVCPNCGKRADFRGIHRAHIIPRSRGGQDTVENVPYECAHCHFTGRHGIREVL